MDVFISWSGDKSRQLAEILKPWLRSVIQSLRPWASASDIGAGERWNDAIQKKLGSTNVGIICLTAENSNAPWILFEAGALAKGLGQSFVCPYLLDLTKADIPAGPLTQFQAKCADKADTFSLVQTLNSALNTHALTETDLEAQFERCWPELDSAISQIKKTPSPAMKERPPEEITREILDIVRAIRREIQPPRNTLNLDESGAASFSNVAKFSGGLSDVPYAGKTEKKGKAEKSSGYCEPLL